MKSTVFIFSVFVLAILLGAGSVHGQSNDQAFPTAVRSNEISGTIKARDIGDNRLTTYFYTFDGSQGDIFVNVVTKNFDGDIDIFTTDGLRPLTKVVIYSDTGTNETGRIVYLRKPERLLLRIQGRTPNDDAATFRIKFAGSFVASNASGEDEVKAPVLEKTADSGVTVNSVGTIVERPAVKAPEAVAKVPPTAAERPKSTTTKTGATGAKKPAAESAAGKADPPTKRPPTVKKPKPAAIAKEPANTDAEVDPMAAFRLIIIFKDGKTIERPMTEVLRFGVDKGVLTLITKEGFVGRYSMANIARVTVE
ncbi:MAG: hypothetical protein KA746_07135 [Pyrinomonadaceae bacterium]|nr:hypothetical protein [Pyrinomonadaceae bacterium]MBP6213935.1 hypothetical protein [Pyrinomonadaceae bacterium]